MPGPSSEAVGSLYLTLSALATTMADPTASESVYTHDILSVVVQQVSWLCLLAMTSWPEPAPEAAHTEIQWRIYSIIAPFIPKSARDTFFRRLHESGGALAGVLVLRFLLMNTPHYGRYDGNNPLEIVVGYALDDPISWMLEDNGYARSDGQTPGEYEGLVERTLEFVGFPNGQERLVRVYVTKTTVTGFVLGNQYTALMNAVTHTEVAVFCPRSTFANESFVREGHSVGDYAPPFDVKESNSHWLTPCDGECPMLRRKTINDLAISLYRWNSKFAANTTGWGTEPDMTEHELRINYVCYGEAITWRVWSRCWNGSCDHSALYEERLRVLGRP